ncbi:MAG: hypothetical protein LW750_06830 [Bacteroidetes bacterium]|jgi:hypothetical protein|nr:hypothetical protein [Bacteroidota bacterium]
METTTKLVLMDGGFTPDDAQEILLKFIVAKINYNKIKNLSHQVHYNREDPLAAKRIEDLYKSKAIVEDLIREARENNIQLNIKSDITIGLKYSD